MILLVSTCTWRCGTALKLHQPHLQTLAPNGASIQKSHSITTSDHCSWCETKWLRRRSCTLKSSCPTDPPWSLCGALPTYTPHTRTSKTNTCRTKQSETEQRKTALTMLYPDTQKNATRLPCTHWHAHTDTHTHDTHEARESVGGEKEVEWDSMQSGGWVKTTGIKICKKCYHRFEG